MTTRLRSKAVVLFAFSAFVACPPIQGRDHEIDVYTKSNYVKYDHKKGIGLSGFVLVKKRQAVQWSCKNNDPQCDQIKITFAQGNPCGSSVLGPAPTASCDGISLQNSVPCVKASKILSCFPYTTTVYHQGSPLNLIDDPEFIVDDSQQNFLEIVGVGIVSVLLGFAGGFGLGRRTQAAR
jgi:hypothetical protein